jgi:hypothetical protein
MTKKADVKADVDAYLEFEKGLTGSAYDKALQRMDWWQEYERTHGEDAERSLFFEIYSPPEVT